MTTINRDALRKLTAVTAALAASAATSDIAGAQEAKLQPLLTEATHLSSPFPSFHSDTSHWVVRAPASPDVQANRYHPQEKWSLSQLVTDFKTNGVTVSVPGIIPFMGYRSFKVEYTDGGVGVPLRGGWSGFIAPGKDPDFTQNGDPQGVNGGPYSSHPSLPGFSEHQPRLRLGLAWHFGGHAP